MNKISTQKGQVIIINTLLFFSLSVAIIFAVTSPVVSSFYVTKSFSKSKQAFILTNSATSEAFYKLTTGKELGASEVVSLSQGTSIISIADTLDGKTISVTSEVDSYRRSQELKLVTSSGVSFNYGLQVGQGGFAISGGSGINGNVYSNGNIIGSNGAYITGTAVSADVSDPVLVASNTGILDPLYQVTFGGNSVDIPQDVAQSFVVSTTTPVSNIRILIKKTGSPWSNVVMNIVTDNSGEPSKNKLAQGTIKASTVTSNFNYLNIPLTNTVSLFPGTRYWIVFDTINFWGPTYVLGANNSTYATGTALASSGGWTTSAGGLWTAFATSTIDTYFDIYAGGSTGLISGVTVGSGGVGDAWSYGVQSSNVAGTIFCQSGQSNNKACDTSRAVPVQQAFPVSDGNYADWKAQAEEGGATTTRSYGYGNHYLGPIKINGDLSVGSGGILNLEGTVYVTGNISLTSGGVIRVNPALSTRSIVLIADGRIKSNGGGQFQGSGTSGSYILLTTTSTCPDGLGCSGDNAVEVSGGTGAVVINAQNGTIEFSGGAQAKQATANRIVMSGGAIVTYESGLVNPTFTTGPSGAWNVDSWKEVE